MSEKMPYSLTTEELIDNSKGNKYQVFPKDNYHERDKNSQETTQLNWDKINAANQEAQDLPVSEDKTRGKLVLTGVRRKGEKQFTIKSEGNKNENN